MTALSKRALHRLSNVEHRARGGKRRCLRQKISVSSTPRRYGRALKPIASRAEYDPQLSRTSKFPNSKISNYLFRILKFNSPFLSVYFKVKSVIC